MPWTQGATRTRAEGRITLSELWPDFIEAPPAPLAASTKSLYQMQWRGDSDDEFAEPLLNLRKIHPGG
jgi:hypothetical protein